MNKIFLIIFIKLVFLQFNISYGQLVIDTASAEKLVERLVGAGVEISNISYKGHDLSRGLFSNGNTTNLGFNEGIILATGHVDSAIGPNSTEAMSKAFGTSGDDDLEGFFSSSSSLTRDASVLEFDFKTTSDSIYFEYIFASEEYNEYVNSQFNDIFTFFLSGPKPEGGNYDKYNMAKVPGTDLFVSINNINNGETGNGPCTNCKYFINNPAGANTTIQYDGFTTILSAGAKVIPCKIYHFKIAIADVSDSNYDSGVFLRAKSFRGKKSLSVELEFSKEESAGEVAYEGCNDPTFNFTLSEPFDKDVIISIDKLKGTATEGVDFQEIPDTIIIPQGEVSKQLTLNIVEDKIAEGPENFEFIFQSTINNCKQDTFTINIDDHISHEIIVSDDDTMCLNESIQLFSSVTVGVPPFTFAWEPAEGLNDSSLQNPIATPQDTTTYILKVYDQVGCYIEDSVKINVNPLPNITILPDNKDTIELCLNDTYTLEATGGDSIWWNNNIKNGTTINTKDLGLGITTYTISALDKTTGCIGKDTLAIRVNPLPELTLTPADDFSICQGDSLGLSASGGDSIWWNNNVLSEQPFSPTTLIQYTAYTIDTTTSCISEDSIIVTVKPLPDTITINADKTTIYRGESVNLNVLNHDINNSLLWSTGDTNLNIKITPQKTDIYEATATNSFNCRTTDSKQINVNQWTVDLGDDIHICRDDPKTISIEPKTIIPEASYLWSTSDTGTSITLTIDSSIVIYLTANIDNYIQSDTIRITLTDLAFQEPPFKGCFTFMDVEPTRGNPPYQYSLDGVDYQSDNRFLNIEPKEYTLYVKDEKGCKIDTIIMINSIEIPNYFSPNDDGINDTWSIKGLEDCYDAIIFIFDKFSRQLYKMRTIDSWNGRYKGKLLDNDTYWYAIEFNDGVNKVLRNKVTIKQK